MAGVRITRYQQEEGYENTITTTFDHVFKCAS